MDFIPRAIFFDLVGTLIRGRRPIGDQYAEELRRHGIRADPARLDLAFGQAVRDAPPMAFPGRTVSEAGELERRWWRQVVRQVTDLAGLGPLLRETSFDSFFAALYERFTTDLAWELYPDVIPTLSALRGRGLLLGLITNYDTRVFPVLEALGLAPLLDSVTIPAYVGAAKPDPSIFRHALDGLCLTPGDALHVGDDLDDDYRGAEAAGMNAVLLDRTGRHSHTPTVRRIDSLADLLTGPGSPGETR